MANNLNMLKFLYGFALGYREFPNTYWLKENIDSNRPYSSGYRHGFIAKQLKIENADKCKTVTDISNSKYI